MTKVRIFDDKTVRELGEMGIELREYFQKKYNITWTNEDTKVLTDRLMHSYEIGFMTCVDTVLEFERKGKIKYEP